MEDNKKKMSLFTVICMTPCVQIGVKIRRTACC